MKLKIGGNIIIWIFAIIMAIIYFTLPPSLHVTGAKEQKEAVEKGQKEYVLYLPKGKDELQTKKVLLAGDLTGIEEIRAVIQANAEALYQSQGESQKPELWNVYQDAKTLYLTFNFGISPKSQIALKKTLANLGVEQEVRILGNGK